MVFSSVVFLFYFLPIFVLLYLLLPPLRAVVIVVGSLLFYGWGDPASIGLLLAFILFNWLMGIGIGRAGPRRRLLLAAGCTVNLGVLVSYKYYEFLIDQVNVSFAAIGMLPWTTTHRELPLGISFFTFQGISYLIDVSRGVVGPQSSLLKFAMYKAMFPQLIAGPIVRYSQIAHEMDDRRVSADRVARGVQVFVIGLAQKVLVANTVAVAADGVFGLPPGQLTAGSAWLGAVCYTVQIYFDFAGYSNMAIGLGHLLGFTLPRNFDNPYLARSMTDFWRRWHITLSTWFRDYLYVPLGGNRRGAALTYRNLLVVFVLCGLWHGAAWTFALWGLFHGVFLMAERLCAGFRLPRALWPVRHAYVLLAVLAGWVLFRADSVGDAWRVLSTMAGGGGATAQAWPAARFATNSVLTALAAAALIVAAPATGIPVRLAVRPIGRVAAIGWDCGATALVLGLFVLSAVAVSAGTYNPFIYFRF